MNLELNNKNIKEMVLAGRGRWKIENEGFNNQKNGLYRIEHLNSKNSNEESLSADADFRYTDADLFSMEQ